MKIISYFIGLLILGSASVIYATDYFYNNNVQNVEVVQKRVIFDGRYFLGTDGYYTVGQNIVADKQQEKVTAVEKENAELRAALEAIYKLLSGNKAPMPTPVPTEPQPEPEPKDDLNTKVNELFKTRCFKCHKDDSNGIDIFDDNGLVNVSLADAVNIHHRTEGISDVLSEGETIMPKGGKPFDNDEMILVKKWLKSLSDKEKE